MFFQLVQTSLSPAYRYKVKLLSLLEGEGGYLGESWVQLEFDRKHLGNPNGLAMMWYCIINPSAGTPTLIS